MSPTPGSWVQAIALRLDEIETLRSGGRVTRAYPEAVPYGPLPLRPIARDAMRAGKHVMKTFTPTRTLQGGDLLAVTLDDGRRVPPGLLPEDLAALLSGKTVTKDLPPPSSPPFLVPGLQVKVIEYRTQGAKHLYTFEAL